MSESADILFISSHQIFKKRVSVTINYVAEKSNFYGTI